VALETIRAGMEPPSTLPFFEELKLHLDLVPYLEIPVQFDHEACFREAAALLPNFFDHRNYDPNPASDRRWRSLGIRALEGDSSRTLYHRDYGVSEPNYQNTWVADRCPETMSFLRSLVDIDQCERIRFMLLEPGARIAVHRDNLDGSVSPALNIALNMPAECEFFIETETNGTLTSRSRKIPFRDGSAFLVNVGKYHYVENNSSVPRIHIIAHGPLRFTRDQLVALAEKQNGVQGQKLLAHRLILKSAGQAEGSEYLDLWRRQGILRDEMAEEISLVVLDPGSRLEKSLRDECVRITTASLWPLHLALVAESELDQWLKEYKKPVPVVLVGAGNYTPDLYRFTFELLREKNRLLKEGAAIVGHVLHFSGNLPHLSEQLVLIKPELIREGVLLGPADERFAAELPAFTASPDHVHHDYTPTWLQPGNGGVVSGVGAWGTPLVGAALGRGERVLAFGSGIRQYKFFAYPRKSQSEELRHVRERVSAFVASEKEKAYFFNNEPLRVRAFPGFAPKRLITVAAGFKPFALALEHTFEEILVVDHSRRGLAYIKGLSACRTLDETVALVARESESSGSSVASLVWSLVGEIFGSPERLQWAQRALHNAEYRQLDFISGGQSLVALCNPTLATLFWHSNSWLNNSVLYRLSEAELQNNYNQLGVALAKSRQGRVWRHRNYFELLVGQSINEIGLVLTDGCTGSSPFSADDYREIK
jgi:hypothetical protein